MLSQGQNAAGTSQFAAITLKGGILRVTPVGPSINERASQIIANELREAIGRAGKRLKALVLDLSQVKQMSSIGLGMCIDARNTVHALGAKTYTISLNRELTELFRMMRVDRLLTMTLNEDELSKLVRD